MPQLKFRKNKKKMSRDASTAKNKVTWLEHVKNKLFAETLQKSDIIIEIVHSHSQNVPNAEAIIEQKITNLINQELLLVPCQTRQRTIKLWEIKAMFFQCQEYLIISVMVTSQVS